MIYKSILLGTLVSLTVCTSVFAQSQNTTTTVEPTELCTMTNGSTIPCVFLEAAEKEIINSGKIVDRVDGTEYCQTEKGYVPCQSMKENGKVTLGYQIEQYINKVLIFIFQYGIYIIGVIALLLLAKVFKKRIKK